MPELHIDSVAQGQQSEPQSSVEARPDFFLVGQPKTGTTALFEMLRQHYGVYIPDSKELHFFCTDLYDPEYPDQAWHPRTIEEYLGQFVGASPGQVVGEASTLYLRSHVAAASIRAFNPEARIVAVLREPASLLRSLHLQLVRQHLEPVKDLRTALALEPERKRGSALPGSRSWSPELRYELLEYSEHVRYVDQLDRFRQLFPPEQVLVLIYDDLRRDNAGRVRQLFEFLGLHDDVDLEPVEANPTWLPRFDAITGAVNWLSWGSRPASRAAMRAIQALTTKRFRTSVLDASRRITTGPPPPVDHQLAAELRRQYAPEVQRLSEYLDRDLVSLWGSTGA
jgi:Sulfotransferase domain